MQRKRTIQKLVAWLLLVVFTISVTPEHLFHDVLAVHHDQPVCRDQDKSVPHFHNPTFHCSFDDLVVSAPYIGVSHQPVAGQPVFVAINIAYVYSSPLSTAFRHTESRGPPMF